MTDKTTFPYTAWRLMPSLKPVQVEIVQPYGDYLERHDYHLDANGKVYHAATELFATKQAAIAAGSVLLAALRERHRKLGDQIQKKTVALAKAELEEQK